MKLPGPWWSPDFLFRFTSSQGSLLQNVPLFCIYRGTPIQFTNLLVCAHLQCWPHGYLTETGKWALLYYFTYFIVFWEVLKILNSSKMLALYIFFQFQEDTDTGLEVHAICLVSRGQWPPQNSEPAHWERGLLPLSFDFVFCLPDRNYALFSPRMWGISLTLFFQ